MTDRDTFAAAALTGLLCNGDFSMESIPSHAFSMADAMLCEREQTNHDAVPEAKADLPDERPPNAVSANGGTPCAASRSGGGTGSTQALTDAEREAVEFFAEIHADDDPPHEYAVILSKLLERLR